MIPSIGVMLGAYVILRSIEILCAGERRTGKVARILIPICCALTIALAVDTIFTLTTGGIHLSSVPQLSNDPASIDALMRRSHEGH
jgi:hypothetical protein